MTFPFCWEGENESVRSRHHLFLLLLLVIAAFIWQAKIGWYGNGLIDVEKKFNPKSWNLFDNAGRVLSETAVTHKNGCGGAISVTERSCAAPISEVESNKSDRCSYCTRYLFVAARKAMWYSGNTALGLGTRAENPMCLVIATSRSRRPGKVCRKVNKWLSVKSLRSNFSVTTEQIITTTERRLQMLSDKVFVKKLTNTSTDR